MDDPQLLQLFAHEGSQEAFGQLVSRHLNLVHSAALRQCDGDPHRAAEVTQVVFTDLARKAPRLARHPALAGWLHKACFLSATKLRRSEARRRHHEAQAAKELALQEEIQASTVSEELSWTALRPVIDECLSKLTERDRECLLRRILEGSSFAELGRRQGLSENAARMRHGRALAKLQGLLKRRGIRSSAGALALALSSQLVQAAPTTLATSITRNALSSASLSSGAGLLEALLLHKLALTSVALLSVSLGAGLYTLRGQLRGLRDDNTQLNAELQTLQDSTQAHVAKTQALKRDYQQLKTTLDDQITEAQRERYALDLIIRRGELDQSHGFLFRRLHLPPAVLKEFKTLLVYRAQQAYNARDLAKKTGMGDLLPSEQKRINQIATVECDQQIRQLIGEDAFKQLEDYENASNWINYLDFITLKERSGGNMDAISRVRLTQAEENEVFTKATALTALQNKLEPDREDTQQLEMSPLPWSTPFLEQAAGTLSAYEQAELQSSTDTINRYRALTDYTREAIISGRLRPGKKAAKDFGVQASDRPQTQ